MKHAPGEANRLLRDRRTEDQSESPVAKAAELLGLPGNPTHLRLLYLLDNLKELSVVDLAEWLEISVSAVSQHLAKLKAEGLVAPRREAQTVYWRLSDDPLNQELHRFFDYVKGAQQSGSLGSPVGNSPVVVTLQDLHDPASGRIDAARTAQYLGVPLKQFSTALGRGYSTVHKTPDAPALQSALRSMKRILTILEEVLGDRSSALAWLNSPHPDLGQRTPLEVILQGYPATVEEMLESALVGTPS